MFLEVDPNAAATKNFLRYILNKLVSSAFPSIGGKIKIMVDELSTPFPKLREFSGEAGEREFKKAVAERRNTAWAYAPSKYEPNSIKEVYYDEADNHTRAERIASYLADELEDACRILAFPLNNKEWVSFTLYTKVVDPEILQQKVQKIGTRYTFKANTQTAQDTKNISQKTAKPYLARKGDYGFLVIPGERDKRIKISRTNRRPFMLLQVLMGTYEQAGKTIEMVFEGIRIKRDSRNTAINDGFTGLANKKTIIKNTRREIYRILKRHKLSGILKIHIDNQKCWLRWNL